MFKLLVPVLILMMSSTAYAETRDELLNKLYQLQGWPELSALQKKTMRDAYSKEFANSVDRLGQSYRLTDADKKKITQLNDRYVDSIINVDMPENALVFWKQNYAANFTDAELEALIKTEELPLQRKAHAAKFAVGSKLTYRYYDLLQSAHEKFVPDYYVKYNAILQQCACKKQAQTVVKPK